MSIDQEVLRRLITSFHILHHHGVINESGNISIRNPINPSTFITSHCPAVLISSHQDLSEWNISDASLVHGSATPQEEVFPEKWIHSCIYAHYQGVNSIIQLQSPESIIYGLCDSNGSMIRSVFNKAGFVNEYNPIFDPARYYRTMPREHLRTLRIDNSTLGNALAESLVTTSNGAPSGDQVPEHHVVFMRGNGAVLWGGTLETAVYKAVNLQRNAAIQTAAMGQRVGTAMEIAYLSADEAADIQDASAIAAESAWLAWAAEVERLLLYRNDIRRRSHD